VFRGYQSTTPMPLPEPSLQARAHSRALAAFLRERVEAAGGWISFADYMRHALYSPGLGYYSAGAHKLGAAGDFVTAPEISPLFAQALARPLALVMEATGGDILELGPGSGTLARQILLALNDLGALPQRYLLLEVSPDLRQRQKETLAQLPAELASRCVWLDALPERFRGVILGNEVLDALPVEIVRRDGDSLWQRGVAMTPDHGFCWADRPLSSTALFEVARARLPRGTNLGEINLEAEALMASLGRALDRGLVLLLDYGYPRAELYHPQRDGGSLRCFYRHHAHDDPFFLPGLQDITAHIDFTAMAEAGADAGLELAGYTSQAQFLLNCGVLDALRAVAEPGTLLYLQASNALNRLLSPAEMGEIIKAIAWTKGIDLLPAGFDRGNRLHRL